MTNSLSTLKFCITFPITYFGIILSHKIIRQVEGGEDQDPAEVCLQSRHRNGIRQVLPTP